MVRTITFALVSIGAVGVLVFCVVMWLIQRREKKRLHTNVMRQLDVHSDSSSSEEGAVDNRMMHFLEGLSQEIASGATRPITFSARSRDVSKFSLASWYEKHATWAGCAQTVSSAAFCEASLRIGLFGCLVGFFLGFAFSPQFAALLAVLGFVFGYFAPLHAVRRAIKKRTEEAESYLSEMLQIVSLGLRSGLSFDRSFALYGKYFNNSFSRSCEQAYRRWALGLSTREESLKDFAASYKCDQLLHVMESVLRSLRFGSSLAPLLEEASAQARASYRAALEERVAKAPVKMMLPTGTLILPAMLLFVLGPVLLELIEGF